MFSRAIITLGIGPHSSGIMNYSSLNYNCSPSTASDIMHARDEASQFHFDEARQFQFGTHIDHSEYQRVHDRLPRMQCVRGHVMS